MLLGQRLLLDPAADEVEVALELRRPSRPSALPMMICSISGRVALAFSPMTPTFDRHLAPAVDVVAEAQDLALDDAAAALLRVEVGARQEHHADRDAAGRRAVADPLDLVVEEVLRDLDMDAGAVAGLAVGIDRAAVPDRLQRLDALLHHLAARLAVDRRDAADAAGVVLVGRVIGMGRGRASTFALYSVTNCSPWFRISSVMGVILSECGVEVDG